MLVCVSPFYNFFFFFSYFLASRLCRSSTWTANTKQKDELRVDRKKEKMIQHNWNVALRYVFYWKEKPSHFIIVILLFLVFFLFSFQVREKNRKVIITVMILPRTLYVVFFFLLFFFETLNFGRFAFYDGAILKYKNKLKKKKKRKGKLKVIC